MKKILIIDDNPTISKIIEKTIIESEELKNKVSLDIASDGFDGLIKTHKINPDLIFIDYDMSYLNGFQITQLIKNNTNYDNTKIIFFSTQNNLFDRMYGYMSGATEYLSKNDLRINTLKSTILKYLFLDE